MQTELECGVYLDRGNRLGRENGRETDRERGEQGGRERQKLACLFKRRAEVEKMTGPGLSS